MMSLLVVVAMAVTVGVGAQRSSDESDESDVPFGHRTVARVIDGDTIALTDGRRVRLAQIDTPELSESECFAKAARATLASLLRPGTRIDLRRDPALDRVDPYGRLVRYVLTKQGNVNVDLVRRGAASVWFVDGKRGRHARRLLRAARRARRSRFGLWRTCPGTALDPAHGVETDAARR
jgi:endonuclease YncB( thermonuclease family)